MPEGCSQCRRATMRRSRRHGWREKFLYALAGYYPWRCTYCKHRALLRNRGEADAQRWLKARSIED